LTSGLADRPWPGPLADCGDQTGNAKEPHRILDFIVSTW
jgi:hypothetical protein